MSYETISFLPNGTRLALLKEIIELIGFEKQENKQNLFTPERCLSVYLWYDTVDYRSWSGIELYIYKEDNNIKVYTRSRSSSSYWDIKLQNKTIKFLRDLLGGYFISDAGKNRYWKPEKTPPSPLASGCYLARSNFNISLAKAEIYLKGRYFQGDNSQDSPSVLKFMDELNPRLISNNMIVPFVIAVWEEYFRESFRAAFQFSDRKTSILKEARLHPEQLERVALQEIPLDAVVANSFTFQSPEKIAKNFILLDKKLNLESALKKPYRRRKVSLFDSISLMVNKRNSFVHEGNIDTKLFDTQLKTFLGDVEVAVERCYQCIGKFYKFKPLDEFGG